MRIAGRRKVVIFLSLGVCLAAVVGFVGFGWIILNWREGIRVFLGVIFFGAITAGLILNTSFLVREIRRDVPVAHDEVAIFDRAHEVRPRVEAVARVEERRERGMHVLEAAEVAVQIAADRAAERVVVVEREAEGRDGVSPSPGGLDEPGGLRALAGAVDAFEHEEESHHA